MGNNSNNNNENYITYDEVEIYDEIIENNTCWPDISKYVPTVDELKQNNIENHVRDYAPFLIYLTNHLHSVFNNKAGYSSDQIDQAKKSWAYLSKILKDHSILELNPKIK